MTMLIRPITAFNVSLTSSRTAVFTMLDTSIVASTTTLTAFTASLESLMKRTLDSLIV